jgi:hypothetical protein
MCPTVRASTSDHTLSSAELVESIVMSVPQVTLSLDLFGDLDWLHRSARAWSQR